MSAQESIDSYPIGASIPHDAPRHSRRRVVAGGIALPVVALGAQLARGIPAFAAPLPIGSEIVVATDRLNFRSAPGLNSTVRYVLVAGDRGTVTGYPASGTGDGIDWYRIELENGDEGWVAGQYIQLDTGGSNAGFPIGSVVEVATDRLNLRATAGLSGTVVDVLVQGDRGVVVAGPTSKDGYSWYRLDVDADGVADGWVAGFYLATASGGFSIGDAVRVADGPLNVRSAAGLSASVIQRAEEGWLFQVTGGPTVKDGYTWLKVFNFGVGTGWIADAFVVLEPDGFPGEDGG
jgi:uncharacterized protein YgiM (DUF1202 family)